MANFVTTANVASPQELAGQYASRIGIYRSVTYDASYYYYHIKTNISTTEYNMFMVEAVGFAYGAGLPIRCAWGGYTYPPYNPGAYIIQIAMQDAYTGLSANGVYKSSDNYVVLRAYGHPYYSGWVLNTYTANPTGTYYTGYPISVLSVAQNANNGTYYG